MFTLKAQIQPLSAKLGVKSTVSANTLIRPDGGLLTTRCKLADAGVRAFKSRCTLNLLMAMSHLLELTKQSRQGLKLSLPLSCSRAHAFSPWEKSAALLCTASKNKEAPRHQSRVCVHA
eukprot:391654-Pelagomonas_calceolata.AAC.1